MFWAIAGITAVISSVAASHGDSIASKILADSKQEPPYHVTGPSVSVVIPTYHEEDYISPALDAIIHQTYTPIEIVISDQTQDQEGIDKIDEIASIYNCRIIHIAAKNVSIGRNMGAEVSNGQIVLFLDADCIMSQTFVEQLITGLVKPDIKISHGVDVFYDSNVVRQSVRILVSNNKDVNFTTGKGVAMWKEDFFDIGGYNENLDPLKANQHEDTDLGQRVQSTWGRESIYLDRTAYVAESNRRPIGLFRHMTKTSTWDHRGYRDGKAIDGMSSVKTISLEDRLSLLGLGGNE